MTKYFVTVEVTTYVSAVVIADSEDEADAKLSLAVDVVQDGGYEVTNFERDGIITKTYEVYQLD